MTEAATPRTGDEIYVFTDLIRCVATSEQTGGGFVAVEVEVPPGGGPPPLHTHEASELFWTLSGELGYFRQEPDGTVVEVTGAPGTSTVIPGGVLHTCRNLSAEPGRCLAVLSPPGAIEAFFLAGGSRPGGAQRAPEAVLELARRHGMEVLDVVPERQP
jgi:mannose-6-phosphate isomerase-like protein (cupin superfamily)